MIRVLMFRRGLCCFLLAAVAVSTSKLSAGAVALAETSLPKP